MNLGHKKQKENYNKYVIIKLLNISDKKQILKPAREKRHITYRGTKIKKINRLLIGNNASQKIVDPNLQST